MRVCSYNASITMCETVLSVYNPIRGRDACVAGSGGGTRYARLPPVIEIKRLKDILAARLPPVRFALLVPGVSGYALNPRLFISLRFHVLRTTTPIRFALLALPRSGVILR